MTSIYVAAFVAGFFTSFGWWTAGKFQKVLDEPPVSVNEQVTEELKQWIPSLY